MTDLEAAPKTETLRLHLVRHGETELNVANRVQGWHDSALTPPGLAAVRESAERVREIDFTAAFVSPSGRTIATAMEFLQYHPGVPMTVDDRLREMNFGDYESHPNAELFALGDPQEIFTNISAGRFAGFPGGERAQDYVARVDAAFGDIVAAHPAGDVLVVSHGWTLFTYLTRAAGYRGAALQNASVTLLERDTSGQLMMSASK